MAGIDLVKAQAKLNEYLAAETKVLAGQDITIDGTRFTRADLAAIQTGVKIWDERVQRLSASATNGGRAVRRVVPIA